MNELSRLEDQLLDIEARTGLLEACRPLGIGGEEGRLERALDSGADRPDDLVPRLDWPVRPALELERVRLHRMRAACERLARGHDEHAEVARILAERASELELEVDIIEARGTPRLRHLVTTRFAHGARHLLGDALLLAGQWIEVGIRDGDHSFKQVPLDLAQELRRLLREADLDVEVHEVEMAARAAVSERTLLVRRRAQVTPSQAARIFTHEVFGHFLPRRAARTSGPPFRVGPRGADVDEEGRALALEIRGGHMDSGRKLELGVRHVLAAAVLEGEHIGEALLRLRAAGAPSATLARAAARVMRAGGLCREVIYLLGLLRVGPALADPEIELVFCAGRATLAEARLLRTLLPRAQPAQSRSATTGV